MSARIRAAGGVVLRGGTIAVIHRPKYDDWTLPKGKLDPGEGWEQAALREVEEETGLACRLERALGSVEYDDDKGRPKTVRFWLMTAESGEFAPNDEVDEMRWVRPAEAGSLLTHERDREVLERLPPGVC